MSLDQKSDNEDFQIGYCALAYRAHDLEEAPINIESVIAILRKNALGGASIKVCPEWKRFAVPEDQEMLQGIIEDFAVRAREDLDGVLKQLSTLEAGSLVTFAAGQEIENSPELLELLERFEEI